MSVREGAGGDVAEVGEADELEQLVRARLDVAEAAGRQRRVARMPEPLLHRDRDVLARGEAVEEARVLERAAEAEPRPPVLARARDVRAEEADPARRGAQGAGDHVEERRLAGAVRPD